MTKHSHYFKDVSGLDVIDVYRLLELFEVTCPVAQHIVKKALAAGKRGAKSQAKDMQDIADSAGRWLQMRQEDDGWTAKAAEAAGFGQINTLDMRTTAVGPAYHDQFDEARVDQVARSHGDGEHYGEIGQ